MERLNRIIVILGLCLLTACSASNELLLQDLQNIVNDFHAENASAPGVCVHVDCPELDLNWSGCSGTIAKDSQVPLTPSHTFRIASNTKTYVAATILRLVEMGELSLDDTLADLISSEWKALLSSDGYDLEAMTLRHVLSHTSGLNDHSADDRYTEAILANPDHQWTADEQIHLCVEWMDPVGAPGEIYDYTDAGYIILGSIIESKVGKNLGQSVHAILNYESLGLASTWWEYMEETPANTAPRAHQYYDDLDVTEWYASYDLYGGGGMVTDTPDLARFMKLLLTGRILQKPSTLKEMMTAGTNDYRLGLMYMQLGGRQAWGHQGFWNTFAFHLPALDLTLSGTVLNHKSENGKILADRLAARIAKERQEPAK